ncbi:MAG: DUF1761 domain-containing protein [Pseudomonadota bacterium]
MSTLSHPFTRGKLSRSALRCCSMYSAGRLRSPGINYQFANRSIKLWLIDGGYHAVQFVLFGLVFGLVH